MEILKHKELFPSGAPHLSEELWLILDQKNSVFDASWPVCDPSKLETDEITIVIQINGKLRGSMDIQKGLDKDDVLKQSKTLSNIKKYLDSSDIIKEINMAIQEGIFPASMSVLNSNLTLNSQQTLEHAEKLIFSGSTGVVLCGTTGMSQYLSFEDKINLIEQASKSSCNSRRWIGRSIGCCSSNGNGSICGPC